MAADTFQPDDNVHTASNQQKLDDLWWRLASTTAGGTTILERQIPVRGADGKPTAENTTLEAEVAWLRQNFASLRSAINALPDTVAAAVLNKQVPWSGYDGTVPATGRTTTNLATTLSWLDTNFARISDLIRAVKGDDPSAIAKAIVALLPPQGTVDAKAVALELGKAITAGASTP
jgi:hypothetical protein